MNKFVIPLVFLIICVVLLAGCSSPASPTTTLTPTTTSAPPSTSPPTSTTPTSTQASGPQKGGTLRIIQGQEITSFLVGEMYSPEDFFQKTPAVETLVRFDEQTQQSVPFLAQSVDEDSVAKTVTFHLRPNVKFQDGTVFDAAACKWNLDMEMKGTNTGPDFANTSSIDVVDPLTVRVSFNVWDNTFLRNLDWDGSMESPTAFNTNGIDWARNNPVGTGPFKLVSFTRDVGKVFKKWDGYWQPGKPYLDEIDINIIADPMVQVASLLKGDNDIINGLDPTDAVNLKSNPNVVVTQGQLLGGVNSLVPDSVTPTSPFAKLEVRQAMAYAIDRKSINDGVYKGYGQVTYQGNSPLASSYNPNNAGYPYNVDKAKQLMIQAGYANGFNTTLWCRPDKIYQNLVVALQSNLAAIGINVTIQTLNTGQYGQMMFGTGWTDGIFDADNVSDPDMGIVARFFYSKLGVPGFSGSIIHPDDLENTIQQLTAAPRFEK